DFDVGLAGAGGYPPVHAAQIIAGLILPHFGKVHAAPAQGRTVAAAHIAQHLFLAVQRQHRREAAQPHQIGGDNVSTAGKALSQRLVHQTTGTRCSSSLMTRFTVMPEASASKLSSKRWRSTSWATACTSSGLT